MHLALAKAYFACLQSSVSQGANVFTHLLGFLGCILLISLTTRAANVYFRMYVSIAVALSSLFNAALSIIFCSPVVKSGLAVNSRQSCAD